MNFKINNLHLLLDFDESVIFCLQLIKSHELDYVTFRFNGIKLRVFPDSNITTLFAVYRKKLKIGKHRK